MIYSKPSNASDICIHFFTSGLYSISAHNFGFDFNCGLHKSIKDVTKGKVTSEF